MIKNCIDLWHLAGINLLINSASPPTPQIILANQNHLNSAIQKHVLVQNLLQYLFFFFTCTWNNQKKCWELQNSFILVFFSLDFSVRHTYFISLAATEAMLFLRTAIKWQDKLFVQHSLKYVFTFLSSYYMSLSLWLFTLSVFTVMCFYFTATVWIF